MRKRRGGPILRMLRNRCYWVGRLLSDDRIAVEEQGGRQKQTEKVDLMLWLPRVMFAKLMPISEVGGRKSLLYFFLESNTIVCLPLPLAPMSTSTSCCKTRPLVFEIHNLPSAIPRRDFMTSP